MLIKLVDGVPVEHPIMEANFLQLFPTISFALPLQPESVEPLGYGVYEFTNKPEEERYKNIIETTPVRNSETGIWQQTWVKVDMTDDERADADAHQANLMRELREFKLIACDWTQLADSPVESSTWLAYRQALRDVPTQTGFPWDITWPTEPS